MTEQVAAFLVRYHAQRAERLVRDAEAVRALIATRIAAVDAKAEQRKARRSRTRARQQAKACRTVPGIEWLVADPCAYCGAANPTTHDHIEPISRGGTHTLDNLARACWRCNREKAVQPLLLFLARRKRRSA